MFVDVDGEARPSADTENLIENGPVQISESFNLPDGGYHTKLVLLPLTEPQDTAK